MQFCVSREGHEDKLSSSAMSGGNYILCRCIHCSEKIEFPEEGIGYDVECPHCGVVTTLYKPSVSEEHSTDTHAACESQGAELQPIGANAALPKILDTANLTTPVQPPVTALPPQIPASAQTKRCPFCAELIHQEAVKCKHCGEFLNTQPTRESRIVTGVRALPPANFKERFSPWWIPVWIGGGIIAILLLIAFFSREDSSEHGSQPIEPYQTATTSTPEPVDPFVADAIVYSYRPDGKQNVVVCSPTLDEAYDFMLKESDTDTKVATSLARKLMGNSYTPESEYVNGLADYAYSKQQQGKLFFIRTKSKMQIVQKRSQGDPPGRSIYECRILEPDSNGRVIFIQQQYLATQP